MGKTYKDERKYRGRAEVPPPGGPLEDKRTKRQRTRQAEKAAWLDDFIEDQETLAKEFEEFQEALYGGTS